MSLAHETSEDGLLHQTNKKPVPVCLKNSHTTYIGHFLKHFGFSLTKCPNEKLCLKLLNQFKQA